MHHSLFDKLKSGGFAEIEVIAVSTNNFSRSIPNGFGISPSSHSTTPFPTRCFPFPFLVPAPSLAATGLIHLIYAEANALLTHTLAGESCSPATAVRIGLFDPGGNVGSQQSAMERYKLSSCCVCGCLRRSVRGSSARSEGSVRFNESLRS